MRFYKAIKISLVILIIIFLSGCYMLNKFVYTDSELEAHYQNIKIKPQYKKIKFLNYNLHYAVIGKNDSLPLLVFVHGAPGAWYGYLNLMDDTLLQQKYKLVSVDRLGYGKSNYGRAEISTQLQALAVKQIIEQENVNGKKIILFGRSYGAPIAAQLAINYPQRVKKLFMISPVIDPKHEKFYWFSNLGKWKIVQWFLPEFLNVATKEKFSHPYEMELMLPEWKKLYVPTYVITGANDKVADTCNYTFAKQHIINCPAVFLKLENTGHLVTHDQPRLIEDLLLEKK